MNVNITVRYEKTENIPECLEMISQAVDDWTDRYPHFDNGYGENVNVYIEPQEKLETLDSEYNIESFLNAISERLKARSVSHSCNQKMDRGEKEC